MQTNMKNQWFIILNEKVEFIRVG